LPPQGNGHPIWPPQGNGHPIWHNSFDNRVWEILTKLCKNNVQISYDRFPDLSTSDRITPVLEIPEWPKLKKLKSNIKFTWLKRFDMIGVTNNNISVVS
jgi:hypothetical protein